MNAPATPSDHTIESLVAPGTPLREAVELIMRQGTGGLVVLGDAERADPVCTGGFDLDDAHFTPQKLAELAKMDGAIVIDSEVDYILKANVHLIPDPTLDTDETGTRQRTAERVALQTKLAVISISEDRGTATVYSPDRKYELQPPTALLAHANQSMQTLERFRLRLDEAEDQLTRAEVEDLVTVREVVLPMQRAALVDRLGEDLESFVVQLGREGGLIRLQLADLVDGVDVTFDLIYEDYAKRRPSKRGQIERLESIDTRDLYDATRVASALGFGNLDTPMRPRGLRALDRVPRLPDSVKDALIFHFGDFQKMLHASVSEFDQVEGVGRARAQLLRHYFDQLIDVSPLWDRHED